MIKNLLLRFDLDDPRQKELYDSLPKTNKGYYLLQLLVKADEKLNTQTEARLLAICENLSAAVASRPFFQPMDLSKAELGRRDVVNESAPLPPKLKPVQITVQKGASKAKANLKTMFEQNTEDIYGYGKKEAKNDQSHN